jgi:serine/threonine protein kinase
MTADGGLPGRGENDPPDALEKAVGDYLDRLNSGEVIDPGKVLAENPRLGRRILEALEDFVDLDSDPDSNAERSQLLGTLGDYTLRRQLGRGGMGVVYEAWENSMDRVVALKVLPPGLAADNKAFHRFLREAKTAGQLKHPNVVSVYSTGVKEGTPWYSMEFIEGETLARILSKTRDGGPESDTPFGPKDRQD